MSNPYADMLNMMRGQGAKNNPPIISTGTVISSNPLQIEFGDLPLMADDLLINSSLSLNAGDIVAIQPSLDRQTYIVLCKVVKP